MPKTVLITGCSGYLGQHLLSHLAQDVSHTLVAVAGSLPTFADDFGSLATVKAVDLSDGTAVAALLTEVAPDVVVHLAAISSPAACEKEPERSRAINECPALIEALPAKASLIFLSTDQVYDGLSAPYSESSAVNPINIYGQSKLSFELAVRAALPDRSVCLRSSLILGPPTPARCRKQS